jgi:hypothetical protein
VARLVDVGGDRRVHARDGVLSLAGAAKLLLNDFADLHVLPVSVSASHVTLRQLELTNVSAKSAIELARAAVRVTDPEEGLTAVAELRTRLDALEEMHVQSALRAGWPWSRVAASLGRSKQAVHKKYAHRLTASTAAGVAAAGTPRIVITGEARRVVRLAREEARELDHPAVGSEHLLLGILRDPAGRVAGVLGALGVSAAAARALVAGRRPAQAPGRRPSTELPPISRKARSALEQSLRESVRRADAHLGVEHIALALVRDRKGRVPELLRALELQPAAVEAELDRLGAE